MDSFPHLIVCEHCDSVYARRTLRRGEIARCLRCDALLERAQRLTIEQWFALSVAAAVLFLLANVYPIVEIRLRGLASEATLWGAVSALAASEAALFALPAALAFIGVPLLQIVLLLWLLGFALQGRRAPGFAFGMRWLERLRPWSMAEVCLLGALVAITKLAGIIDVAAGPGLWALAGLTVLIIIAAGRDLRQLWQVGAAAGAPSMSSAAVPRAEALGLIACHTCGLACAAGLAACPRCAARLHRRKPGSTARTASLLAAAAIFYVPSNLVPVMHTQTLGGGFDSTILQGVGEFWRSGDWDIALIIFIASVVVPCTKFLVLGFLLLRARSGDERQRRDRARLYRMVEFIGYWSMLDVVVVALLAAAVQFNQLSAVTPRPGIAFFGIVVVLTMLAAMSFDARTIWDEERRRGHRRA